MWIEMEALLDVPFDPAVEDILKPKQIWMGTCNINESKKKKVYTLYKNLWIL